MSDVYIAPELNVILKSFVIGSSLPVFIWLFIMYGYGYKNSNISKDCFCYEDYIIFIPVLFGITNSFIRMLPSQWRLYVMLLLAIFFGIINGYYCYKRPKIANEILKIRKPDMYLCYLFNILIYIFIFMVVLQTLNSLFEIN